MQNTQSLCIRVFLLITGLTQCLALKQISVIQGDTLTLTCPLTNTNMSDAVEWRNPEGFLLFFNRDKALRDQRIKFVTLTNSKFSIRVTDVTFKDGGVYKCLHYRNPTSTKRYKVIVIGAPRLEKDEQEDKTIVKCSASANQHPPRLSWLMDSGLEVEAHPYYESEHVSKKYTAVSQLTVKVPKKGVTMRCLVRHSALHGSKLERFIHLGNQSQDTTTSSTYSSNILRSTDTTVIPTLFSNTSFTNSHSESETTNDSSTTVNETTDGTSANGSTNILSNTTENETTESVYETTDGTPSNTSINSSNNTTGNDNSHVEKISKKRTSTLLVLLVTCLLSCLFVVLAFFLIRLRKAHIAWKKENEESDQSVESSRSKSSSEEKLKQQQKGRGFWNTSFTKYKAEETLEKEAQATPASVQVINENPQHFIARSGVKETEL
ncbi:cytotoxic and regulatory T-cell molecule [Ictalurus punctatus]|uniref:Cytotoxic and regulatory T-cell molecule n=1 Tax=Ictalurus punctatus TaxID=7998 RepID=A0A2D0SRQ2_ICTPU|nr:cytotoxic and regulatory T-cell molecule [Ictalurus punctatus]